MKIVLVITIATYLVNNYKRLKYFKTYLIPIGLTAIVCGIMYFQDHLSGAVVILVGAIATIFASGIKINFKVVIVGLLVMLTLFISFIGYSYINKDAEKSFRLERITGYLNPEEDLTGINWQAAQSLYAIGTGGIFGLGLRSK